VKDLRGARRGMGGHHAAVGASDEWYTPPAVFDALGLTFDLDPCAPPPPAADWIPAARRYSLPDDGLVLPWEGRVYLNPPYGSATSAWVRRLAAHGDGIALVFARTDTAWFHEVAQTAHALCFLAGRLTFVPADSASVAEGRTNGNAGAPSLLMAFGEECAAAVAASGLGMTFAVRSRPASRAQITPPKRGLSADLKPKDLTGHPVDGRLCSARSSGVSRTQCPRA